MIVFVSIGFVIMAYIFIRKVYENYWDKTLKIDVFFSSNHACEGEGFVMKQVIVNNKLLPLPILEVFFHLNKGLEYGDMSNALVSDRLYRRDVFSVGGKKKISRTLEINCKKRGYYTLEEIEMMTYDLFIQYKSLGKQSCFQEVYVYPRKVSSNRIVLPYRKIMGDLMAKKELFEDPFSFAGLRDYTPQDSMNSINWKATAKAQDLVVNMYDSSKNQKIVIILDTYENKTAVSEDLNEEAIRIVTAILERLLIEGVSITLEGNGRDSITNELLEIQDIKLSELTKVKQRLATLERGYEKSALELLEESSQEDYVLLVSKNIELQEMVRRSLKDFFWIIPYQYKEPSIAGVKGSYMTWEMEMSNIG